MELHPGVGGTYQGKIISQNLTTNRRPQDSCSKAMWWPTSEGAVKHDSDNNNSVEGTVVAVSTTKAWRGSCHFFFFFILKKEVVWLPLALKGTEPKHGTAVRLV